MSTELYRQYIDYAASRGKEDLDLAHEVWDATPWIVDAWEGDHDSMRYRDMLLWCDERWGNQAWWPSGRPGSWQRGSAIIFGWNWWGFDTEDKMHAFMAQWPSPENGNGTGTENHMQTPTQAD